MYFMKVLDVKELMKDVKEVAEAMKSVQGLNDFEIVRPSPTEFKLKIKDCYVYFTEIGEMFRYLFNRRFGLKYGVPDLWDVFTSVTVTESKMFLDFDLSDYILLTEGDKVVFADYGYTTSFGSDEATKIIKALYEIVCQRSEVKVDTVDIENSFKAERKKGYLHFEVAFNDWFEVEDFVKEWEDYVNYSDFVIGLEEDGEDVDLSTWDRAVLAYSFNSDSEGVVIKRDKDDKTYIDGYIIYDYREDTADE